MFEKITPEQAGISSRRIADYISVLERRGFATHSLLMMKGDKIFAEYYWAPFHKDFCHRMYSQTKSYVGIAIGLVGGDADAHMQVISSVTEEEKAAAKAESKAQWEEAKAMCMAAARKVPQMRFIAWDVAITENGPTFIEGNSFPSHAIPQFAAHYPDGIGILPEFEKFMDL